MFRVIVLLFSTSAMREIGLKQKIKLQICVGLRLIKENEEISHILSYFSHKKII